MTDLLVDGLSRIDAERWIRSILTADNEVLWLPVVQISLTGLWLGLDSAGQWILGRTTGSVVASNVDLPQPWLTVLDMNEPEFLEALDRASSDLGLTPNLLRDKVPVDEVILLGLRSGSGHWAKQAVQWLTNRPVDARQLVLLETLMTARWVDQRTRQAASRIVKANKGH